MLERYVTRFTTERNGKASDCRGPLYRQNNAEDGQC